MRLPGLYDGPMASCILCDDPDAPDLLSGFSLCGSCRYGGVDAGARKWGLQVEHERTQKTTHSNDRTTTTYTLEVRVAYPSPLDATAHFRPESGSDRFWQWFNQTEFQAGDPLFDRAVFVEEPTGEQLRQTLADEGVQSAILELCPRGGVRMGPGWVRVRRSSTNAPPSLHEHALPLLLLAVHLESLAQVLAAR